MAYTIRSMGVDDLPAVAAVTNAAFGALHGAATGAELFAPLLFSSRLAADPPGCLVAVPDEDPGHLVGVLFSVARGSLGWFGPLAVRPGDQRSGAGEGLVRACLESWARRGVGLRGLETLAASAFHVRFYSRLGFRPSWTGIELTGATSAGTLPDTVVVDGPLPDLDFLRPGLDLRGEADATISSGAGHVLCTAEGMAIVHLAQTFQGPATTFVPFLAAPTRAAFSDLMTAAEHLGAEQGHTSVVTRVSGSAWNTLDALDERGYQAGPVMVRMKAGTHLDYDAGEAYYLDNWL